MAYVVDSNFKFTADVSTVVGNDVQVFFVLNIFGNNKDQRNTLGHHDYYVQPLNLSRRKNAAMVTVITSIKSEFKDKTSHKTNERKFEYKLDSPDVTVLHSLENFINEMLLNSGFVVSQQVVDYVTTKFFNYLSAATHSKYFNIYPDEVDDHSADFPTGERSH